MDTRELVIGERAYRVGRLAPMKQFHVARRLAPLLQALVQEAGSSLDDLAQLGGVGPVADPETASQGESRSESAGSEAGSEAPPAASTAKELMRYIQPVLERLSEMSDEETEYVIMTCLRVCQRQQDQGWAPVLSPRGDIMFHDLGALEMLNLTREVIQLNLSDFFPGAPIPS